VYVRACEFVRVSSETFNFIADMSAQMNAPFEHDDQRDIDSWSTAKIGILS